MAGLVTYVLLLSAIAAVFGIVYSDERIYNAVDALLNRLFEKFD